MANFNNGFSTAENILFVVALIAVELAVLLM